MSSKSVGKLREPEARLLALQIAAKSPGHEAATKVIKERVPDYREFSPADLKPSTTRRGECMWQQIIGNVVSHSESRTSIFKRGFAERTRNGIRVTEKVIDMLKARGRYP